MATIILRGTKGSPLTNAEVDSNFTNINTEVLGIINTMLPLKANLASPTFTGIPKAPTAALNTNTTQLATTAFVIGQAGTASPIQVGVSAVGTSTKFAREDHSHPTNATNTNTASTIVARDASGNFSAGTITAALTGNASTATTLATARTINGTSFNGSAAIDIQWKAIAIPASADLNTYQSEGAYFVERDITAATLVNSPTDSAFSMRVWRASSVVQEITEYLNHDARKTYQRAL